MRWGMASADYLGPPAAQAVVLPARAVYLIADQGEGGLRWGARPARPRRTRRQFPLLAEPLMRSLAPTGDR